MQKQSLQSLFLVARIIAFAYASSIAFFYLAVRLIGGNFKPHTHVMEGSTLQIIQIAFIAVCAAAFIAVFYYKKMILAKKIDLNQGPEKFVFNITLFSLFAAELPGLLGLILYIMGRNLTHFYIAIGVSAALFILFFPRFQKWEELYKQIIRP